MAELLFENIIDLTSSEKNSKPKLVKKLMIGNEPNNDIWQYYLSSQNARDKASHVDYSNYTELSWDKPTHSMTALRCRDFGMKTFPGIGAIGFYTPRVGTSKILVPIHVEHKAKFKPPILSMNLGASSINFTIKQPSDITYTCFRIILQSANNTFEYITYDETSVIDYPTVKGNYRCWCVGYVDEGLQVSEDSNVLSLKVESGTELLMPINPEYSIAANTYTKPEVDALIGSGGGGGGAAFSLNSYSIYSGDNGSVSSAMCSILAGSSDNYCIAIVATRSTTTFSDGWQVLKQYDAVYYGSNDIRQTITILGKRGSSESFTENLTVGVETSGRIYILMLSFSGIVGIIPKDAYSDTSDSSATTSYTFAKGIEPYLYIVQTVSTSSDNNFSISPTVDTLVIPCGARLCAILDISNTVNHTVSISNTNSFGNQFISVALNKSN